MVWDTIDDVHYFTLGVVEHLDIVASLEMAPKAKILHFLAFPAF